MLTRSLYILASNTGRMSGNRLNTAVHYLGGKSELHPVVVPREIGGTGTVLDNIQEEQSYGKCHRKYTAPDDAFASAGVRVKWCGAPRRP